MPEPTLEEIHGIDFQEPNLSGMGESRYTPEQILYWGECWRDKAIEYFNKLPHPNGKTLEEITGLSTQELNDTLLDKNIMLYISLFELADVNNFLTFGRTYKNETTGELAKFTITIQREEGVTPAEYIYQLESELSALRDNVAEVEIKNLPILREDQLVDE